MGLVAALPINKLLADLYEHAKGPLKQGFLSVLTDEAKEKRERYRRSVGEVKTIWQVDRFVDIQEFYYPTKIDFETTAYRVSQVEELLRDEQAVVVEGVAGQGKSIFLRYLCVQGLSRQDAIPVFVQLRHVSDKTTLLDLIVETLGQLGITDNKMVIEYLLRNGRLVLLLDGFDEIDSAFRAAAIRTLETYLQNYRKLRIVVSSRPDSDIQRSPRFCVTKIKPLSQIDRDELVSHLVDDIDTRQVLLEALKGKGRIVEVLSTPLLVTLLIITYKAESEIPENLSDFYRALFVTLMRRHDRTKPGYKRERRTTLGNVEFERVFENLCFASLNHYKQSLTEREFHDFAVEALRANGSSTVSADAYMEDLVRITCLLVQDGLKYYYLHKSIPEYFAAQKIASEKNPSNKQHFFQQLRENPVPDNWYQTLAFLGEIDEYAFTKELLLPYYCSTFKTAAADLDGGPPTFQRDDILELVGPDAALRIRYIGSERYVAHVDIESQNWLVNTRLRGLIEATFQEFVDGLSEFLFDPLLELTKRGGSVRHCFDEGNLWPSFLGFVNSASPLRLAFHQATHLRDRVARQERLGSPLFDLNL